MRSLVLTLVGLVASACVEFGTVYVDGTTNQRAHLDSLYPLGAERPMRYSEADGESHETVFFGEEPPADRTIRRALEDLQSRGLPRAVGYDVFSISGRVLAYGGDVVCLRVDYVFFDAANRIIRAYRQHLTC